MTLGDAQRTFAGDVARLILWAVAMGYEVTWGWAYRPPEFAAMYAEMKKGIANSLHELRLAVDLNLFRDGVYLTKTEDYKPLGDHWKSLRPENAWGGDFQPPTVPDGNHFSRAWEGRR